MTSPYDRVSEDPEPPDYPLGHAAQGPPPAVVVRRQTAGIWVAALVLLVGAALAWVVVSRGRKTAAPPVSQREQAQSAEQPLPPLGGTPAAVIVPPLDQSDDVVRELVRQLTTHPAVVAWLATDGLIRNFTVSIANLADGSTPERHLRRLRPAQAFAVQRQGDRLVIDPASYHRYDALAAAAASVDADGAARLYATLKPRIEEAYRDLGHPDTSVDQAIEQAIAQLLRTPVIDRPLRVEAGSKGIGYVYADDNLEGLTGAQKQLLRMGPDNVRTVQRALRAIAGALGIPVTRLPAATQ